MAASSNAAATLTSSTSRKDASSTAFAGPQPFGPAASAALPHGQAAGASPADLMYAPLHPTVTTGAAAAALSVEEPAARRGSRAVNALLERLMATNPKSIDVSRAIESKVQDRAIMLDNPPVQRRGRGKGAGGGVARYTALLLPKRKQRQLALYELKDAQLT